MNKKEIFILILCIIFPFILPISNEPDYLQYTHEEFYKLSETLNVHELLDLQYFPEEIINPYILHFYHNGLFYPKIDKYNKTVGENDLISTAIGYTLLYKSSNETFINYFKNINYGEAIKKTLKLQQGGLFKNSEDEEVNYRTTFYAIQFLTLDTGVEYHEKKVKNALSRVRKYIFFNSLVDGSFNSTINYKHICETTYYIKDIIELFRIPIPLKTIDFLDKCFDNDNKKNIFDLLRTNKKDQIVDEKDEQNESNEWNSINDKLQMIISFIQQIPLKIYNAWIICIYHLKESFSFCSINSILFSFIVIIIVFNNSIEKEQKYSLIFHQIIFMIIVIDEHRQYLSYVMACYFFIKKRKSIMKESNSYFLIPTLISLFSTILLQQLFTPFYYNYCHILLLSLIQLIGQLSFIIVKFVNKCLSMKNAIQQQISSLNQSNDSLPIEFFLCLFYFNYANTHLITFYSPYGMTFELEDYSSFYFIQLFPSLTCCLYLILSYIHIQQK